jgi:hypothetical protein
VVLGRNEPRGLVGLATMTRRHLSSPVRRCCEQDVRSCLLSARAHSLVGTEFEAVIICVGKERRGEKSNEETWSAMAPAGWEDYGYGIEMWSWSLEFGVIIRL